MCAVIYSRSTASRWLQGIPVPEGLKRAGGYREHDILVISDEGNIGSVNITAYTYGPEQMIVKKIGSKIMEV